MLNFFQQDTLVNSAQEVEPLVEEKTLSLMDLLFSGGTAGTVIIIILFVLLFVAVYIYFERLFAIKAASETDSNFMHQIKDSVLAGNIESARIRCAQANSPVARLTAKGLDRIGHPLEDINTAIENAGRLEVYKLEKNVSVLATIAGAGPDHQTGRPRRARRARRGARRARGCGRRPRGARGSSAGGPRPQTTGTSCPDASPPCG